MDKLRPKAIWVTILLSELISSIMLRKYSARSASTSVGKVAFTVFLRTPRLSVSPSPK